MDSAMFDQWVNDLRHADAAVRYEAAQKLGASNDNAAVQPLIGALTDDNAKVQYAAVSGLVKLDAAEAASPIIDLLLNARACRVWDLLKLNIGMRLRNGLLDMAGRIEMNPTTMERLSAAIDGEEYDELQRAFFVRLLGRTMQAEHVERLIDMLAQDTVIMQGAAAEALGWLRDERAVPMLLLTLNDDDANVREIALEALGRIGHPAALEALMEALHDESEWLRRAAAQALGDLGDPRAMHALTAALQDDSRVVQDAAFESIKRVDSARGNEVG
jgi:HEAT repeat protein